MLQRPRTAPMRADRRRRRRRKANRNGSDTRGTAGNSDGFGSSDPATSPWSPSSHSSRPLSSGFKKYHDGGGGGRNRHHLQSSSSSSLAASSRVVQSAGRFRQGKSKSKSPSSSSSSSPASSPGYRPRTAPAPGSRKSHRKEAHMSIQDILGRNAGNPADSGPNMLAELQKRVRKSFERRRGQHDRLQYQAAIARREVMSLRLSLRDLKKNGKALGLEEYPDIGQRLQPIRRISNRPVYTRHTRIQEMELEMDEEMDEITALERKNMTYTHIRDRHRTERVEERRDMAMLKEVLKEEHLGCAEYKRVHLQQAEALSKAQSRLVNLKKKCKDDLKLWERELSEREQFASQKLNFQKFYTKQVQKQREIELEHKGDLTKAQEDQLKKRAVTAKLQSLTTKRSLAQVLRRSEPAEEEYHAAFRSVGLKFESDDPSKVVKMLLTQEETRKVLESKVGQCDRQYATLQQDYQDAKEKLAQMQLQMDRTTNRLLAEKETELHALEKSVETSHEELAYLKDVVTPVMQGLYSLAQLVMKEKQSESANTNANGGLLCCPQDMDTAMLFGKVHARLSVLRDIQMMSAAMPDERSSKGGGIGGGGGGRDGGGRGGRIGSSGVLSSSLTAQFVSPYNCRVSSAQGHRRGHGGMVIMAHSPTSDRAPSPSPVSSPEGGGGPSSFLGVKGGDSSYNNGCSAFEGSQGGFADGALVDHSGGGGEDQNSGAGELGLELGDSDERGGNSSSSSSDEGAGGTMMRGGGEGRGRGRAGEPSATVPSRRLIKQRSMQRIRQHDRRRSSPSAKDRARKRRHRLGGRKQVS